MVKKLLVKEKHRQRHKNSSFIARAVIENNEKFKIIDELYREHKTLIKTKDEIMTRILNIYSLGFKKFSRRKIILGAIKGRSYYASIKGIVRPVSSSQVRNNRTEDIVKSFVSRINIINIYQEIMDIGLNRRMLWKHMNPSQKKIFNAFFKNYKYAKEESRVVLKMKIPLKVIELTANFVKPHTFKVVDSLSLINNGMRMDDRYNGGYGGGYGGYDFHFMNNNESVSKIRFSRLYVASGVNEKIFIEQTFTYLKRLLNKEIENRQREIKRLSTFYLNVKKDFADYILLDKIEGE